MIQIPYVIFTVLFVFFLPGYLITTIFYKFKQLEKILISIIISISLAIFLGFLISLVDLFNIVTIYILYFILNGGLFLRWMYR
jgi:uncharacterized membrane protein